jgi:hypothetical protein
MRWGGTVLEYPLKTVPPRPSEHQAQIAVAPSFRIPFSRPISINALCGIGR